MPLILRGRVAWAHDWVSNPALGAVFQSLPGASFIVNGAPIPPNSALTSIGAELWLSSTWSVIAKFDGEFASDSRPTPVPAPCGIGGERSLNCFVQRLSPSANQYGLSFVDLRSIDHRSSY